ncbi:MAG TPA: TetR/AcrR family transcriptional regulator [Acidimicrobiia bacterium]|nr:TetR/AcrR family transcriptional regulator [Acidimicrobiia bacterium]
MQNAILPPDGGAGPDDVAGRVAGQALAKRRAAYETEVRRLLDAALRVMRRCGTTARPRVADIVAAAGLSNDAFYRHFPSKDALVEALLEDGAARLVSYLRHQMGKADTPEGRLRRFVEGVLSQAEGETAETTLAVLWNGGSVGRGPGAGNHFAAASLAALVREPLAELGSPDPELDAALTAHATLGRLTELLWQRARPAPGEADRIVAFLVGAASTRAEAPI